MALIAPAIDACLAARDRIMALFRSACLEWPRAAVSGLLETVGWWRSGSKWQKIRTLSPAMIRSTGLCAWTGAAVIFCPASIVEVMRTVAERARMKVVLRTLGREASVADWLTRLFRPSLSLCSVGWRRHSDGSQRARRRPRAIDAIAEQLLLDGQPREWRGPGVRTLRRGGDHRRYR
jgi:hypothetical protein